METREAWEARRAAEARAAAEAERRAEEARRAAGVEAERRAEASRRAATAEAERRAEATRGAAAQQRGVARPWISTRVRFGLIALLVGLGVLTLLWTRVNEEPVTVAPPTVTASMAPSDATAAVTRDPGPYLQSPVGTWADRPTIPPSPQGWWCVCYKTIHNADHTACRRQAQECEALRTKVEERGSNEILKGSANGPCRHVGERYPWDKLGSRAAWRESAHPSAAQANGVCAL